MASSPTTTTRVPRALLAALLVFLPALAFAQVTEVLVVTPVPAPDGNGTIENVIHQVGYPDYPGLNRSYGAIVNDAGQVAFPGYLTGTAGGQDADDSGLFFIDDNDEEVVQLYRAGDPAPDGNGVFYYYSWSNVPSLNGNGRTAAHQLMTENDSGDLFERAGLTVLPGQAPEIFLRENGLGPDGQGTIQSLSSPMLTDNGLLGLSGLFDAPDPGGAPAVFRGDVTTGDIEVIAREGDVPPDGNGHFELLSPPDINEAGQMVFSADVAGSDELDDAGLFFVEADGTTIRQIARVGDPAPGGGVVYTIDSGPKSPINEAGQVAYTYFSAPCGDCQPDTQHLFRYDSDTDTSTELLRTGTPSPDGGLWYSFKNVHRAQAQPALNDAGQIAFHGETARGGLIFTGFYRTDGTETIRITDNGEPTPSGNGYFLITSLSAPHGWDSRDVPKMNERGQVAFFTNLQDTDLGGLDNQGIFFYDDEQGLMEVVRTYDELLGDHIRELRFIDGGAAAHDNARSGLNNLGQVAYAFQLEDGRTGIALWTPPSGVTVEATPLDPPVKVPPGGGTFSFEVTLTNTTDEAKTFQAWTEAREGPGGLRYEPVIGPRTLTLAPGASLTRTVTQSVPAAAPAGVYDYNVNAGTFPELESARGSFVVEKEADPAARALATAERTAPSAEAWTATGWDGLAEAAAAATAPSERTAETPATAASETTPAVTRLDAPYPNPAGGRAMFAYDLAEAADVRLAVYDVLGREVAVLADGPEDVGTHGVPFDTAQLPAGTYLVRLAAGEVQQTQRFTVVH